MLWFYDFEVFTYDWLVVFINPSERCEEVIINDAEKLEAFHEANKNKIFVGFNSRHYDQYIFKGILCGFNPKRINDFIIVKGAPGWKFSTLLQRIPLHNYDVFLSQTDKGLKSMEGFMGHMIKESSVPFDIDRQLTKREMDETVKYCRYDVTELIDVFLQRVDEFNTMMYFIKHFKLPLSAISKTKAQLAAEILGGNKKGKSFDDEFQFPIVECLSLTKYRYVADWYRNEENHKYNVVPGNAKSGKHQLETVVAGIPHVFGWGGAHGAISKYHAKGDFLIIDVTAYYPSMQKQFKFGYRVMDNPENFEFIHNSNIEFKKEGDKKARLPFKIMDNAISGQMKQEASALYDPMSNNSICVNGQLLLLDLIEHLEQHVKLVNNNTDGLIIQLCDYERDFDVVDKIVAEWEQRTGLEMEFDTFFGEIFQKDVNNYLIVDHETGAIKSKGGYVKKLSPIDYDLPIINRALVDFMVNGVPVEQTINGCDDLKEFQLVMKISGKHTHIQHGGKRLKEKCIRVFASKDDADAGVQKIHAITGRPAKMPNSPLHCFIFNDEVNGVRVPGKLNKRWYIDLANKRLGDFGI
jgi:DNA polymerase